jgi:hypothetical protein
VRRGNAGGARAQAAKAQGELTPFRPSYLGLDVETILRDIHRLTGATTECRAAEGRIAGHSLLLEFRPVRARRRARMVHV